MRTFDLSPLYRSTVGFDRLFGMLDSLGNYENGNGGQTYPPYNIERTGENAYRVALAVAGFGESDIQIEVKEGTLTVSGKKEETAESEGKEVLYRGIAARSFERRFQLADHVQVTSASLEHGLLHVDLVREIPEAMKPRTIAINANGGKAKKVEKQVEAKVAA
jgi:molecular chaperone IbpA